MAGDEDQRLEDHSARLPDDVLADVLRRVPPRWLAASRCVCRAWRDAVDGRHLLRADLLPLSFAGLFVHFDEHKFPEFFARPSSAVSGDLSFLPSASPHCGNMYDEDCVDAYDYTIEDEYWLRVWILNESCGQTEWVLKHDKDLMPMLARHLFYTRVQWILKDINYNLFLSSNYIEGKKATSEENMEWNSDNEVENEDIGVLDGEHYHHYYDDIEILGFHPYKEIVFLNVSQRTGLAYNLNGSKIEKLGNIYPKEYTYFQALSNQRETIKSFPYTPCWIEEFQ